MKTSATTSLKPPADKVGNKKRMSKRERKALKKQTQQNKKGIVEEDIKTAAKKDSVKEDSEEENYLESYSPIPVPNQPDDALSANNKSSSNKNDDVDHEGGGRTLGKWFPNAILVKCSVNYTNTGQFLLNNGADQSLKVENPKSSLVLFYQYTKKQWSQPQLKILMTYLSNISKKRNIGGRIRVAQEGVNATISSVDLPGVSSRACLRHLSNDLRNFDPIFEETDFKYLDDLPPDRHFKEFKILPVQELVFYDIKEDDAPLEKAKSDGSGTEGTCGVQHLDAIDYHKMLQKDNTVVIDVRNHYENIIGRFDGQMKRGNGAKDGDESASTSGGAEYLDPLMRKSTDFKSWLAKDKTKEKIKDKTVLMYCTGGIRCERASVYLQKEMGGGVNGVYQLKGGIERYLKAFPDGGFWRGKNFVFDKREAVSAKNPDGDGGVIRKQKKKSADDNGDLPAKCCVCDESWDRYVGKKKCFTCGVPVLMCDKCMSLKPDKTPGMQLKVRCPLCKVENITVPASAVEFTANGIKGKIDTSSEQKDDKGKAAQSVLKWGGGHASQKKRGRKMKRRLCQFGSECIRKECFFAHPERDAKKQELSKKAKT